jgi:hypothetical protein
MNYDQPDNGLAESARDPRAVTGKHAHAANNIGEIVAGPFEDKGDKARESAPFYSNNPRPSIDGLPSAILSGANLAGGGLDGRSQFFSFQSGHGLSQDGPKGGRS